MSDVTTIPPVFTGTEVPWPKEAITSMNADQITLMASWQLYDIISLAFSPDGKMIALGSKSGLIKLLSTANGQELRTLNGHRFWVRSMDFSPDGTMLASKASDETTRLWDVTTGKELYNIFGGDDQGWGVGGKPSVDFSPNGKLLAFSGPNGQVRLWDVINHVELQPLGNEVDPSSFGAVSSIAFSPDGNTLAVGYAKPNFGAIPSIIHLIVLWNPISGQVLYVLEYSGDQTIPNISSLDFSPDGSKLASGYFEAKITLWDITSKHELYTISDGWEGEISDLDYSLGGDVLAICSDFGQFRLVDAANGTELVNLDDLVVDALAFSPDGKVLISVSMDGFVQLWGIAP
jgi:WD40 repeat protein